MNILDETAAALPEVSERLRDFLAPRMGRPAGEAAPGDAAPEAEAAEAESGSEDAGPEPDEAGDAPHEPAPTAEAEASTLVEHPLDGAQ